MEATHRFIKELLFDNLKVTEIQALLTALCGGVDGLSDLVDDVAHGACDVGDAGGESLVHIGRQVLDVGDELLHLAEGADHLQGRAQLAAVCHRTQRPQQVQPRSPFIDK